MYAHKKLATGGAACPADETPCPLRPAVYGVIREDSGVYLIHRSDKLLSPIIKSIPAQPVLGV